MELTEKTLSRKYIFRGKIINLRIDEAELPNGNTAEREVIEHPGGVCVAALTNENEILLVSQFRYPYGKVLLELPAGKLEYGENPRECGIRELAEETGANAGIFEYLGEMYPSPGYCNEIISIYYACELTFSKQNLDEDEFLNVRRVPLREAVEMVEKGEIRDAKTQIALLKLSQRVNI